MNKELLALDDIILYLNANEPKGLYCKQIETIKTALKDYEELDLRVKENNLLIDTFYKVIKKQEQVLKIIKEKKVDILPFIEEIVKYDTSYEGYIEGYSFYHYDSCDYCLTETEFKLLKEYLK